MPARVNVYCTRSVAHLTPAMFRAELDEADLMTLAEALDLPEGEEEAVEAMLPHLRVEGDPDRFAPVEVYWKPGDGRPIQIARTTDVAGEIAETLENLPASRSNGARRVRDHLARTIEIVHVELGIDDSLHLGATLSEVLAFFIAEQGDGLVWFYHRDWASPDDRGANLWVTRS